MTTYTGTPDAPLLMDTPGVTIARWEMNDNQKEQNIELQPDQVYSIYVLKGVGSFNGQSVKPNDFIIIENTDELKLATEEGMELFVITTPVNVGYPTYGEMM